MNDLDLTSGVDLHSFLRESSQEGPAAGGTDDGTAESIDGFVSRGGGGRLLGPDRESRNSRDDGFLSKGRGGRVLGPSREGRNSRDDGRVSKGHSGRLLGLGREG